MYKKIPQNIQSILDDLHCPILLNRHLILVYNLGLDLTEKIIFEFPTLRLLTDEIVFGTATHDIGKIIEKNELREKGKQHEQTGYKILMDYGIKENLARFTITHGDWENENLAIEDLIVTLADKIWKGQRIDKLEEKVIAEISKLTNIDYWTVYLKIDNIISQIINGSDKRLNWQNNFEI
ncbi:HD domain-containing protein [Chryseobacterium joostei]|uniref:HD domain-containing protein n=1 Tax=Chryseobacterium joostei TaxID=112234 RepID=A0A1N7ILX7_9FLAO|nr:HD domain-containing protein [Chryseobacterium joostei]AZA98514.1 HD domain-containing protein [Chryseobacterium joostei]SIS38080.1 HD domain-containing protein [Chryseobacterium joostei]